MNLALHPGRRLSNTGVPASRTTRSKGCWICRLRRKKCDEKRPVCDTCAALFVTCHYSQTKPDWMDGDRLQEEMAIKLKREVRESAAIRRAAQSSGGSAAEVSRPIEDDQVFDNADPETHSPQPEPASVRPQRGHDCGQSGKYALDSVAFGRPDTVLLMFYLEHLFPFLFPFYQPSILEGGRAWVLEMMISSPFPVRQAILCQSSYFFSLAREIQDGDMIWETMLTQTGEAFGVLRQSLQVIDGSDVTEHIHGAVRIISGILQVQRFEVAVLGFANCQAHLNAARALFKQLLDRSSEAQPVVPSANFNAVVCRLGPPSWIAPGPVPISSYPNRPRFEGAIPFCFGRRSTPKPCNRRLLSDRFNMHL